MWSISGYYGTDQDIQVFSGYYDINNKDISNNLIENFENNDKKVFVYIAKIKDAILYSQINLKNKFQLNNNDSKVTRQRCAGYGLLHFALQDRWGLDEDFSNITISPNGKPYSDKYKFSISHSGDLVCVAISEEEVGIDIERITLNRRWERLSRRILTLEEQDMCKDDKTMTVLWTKKEAVFKLQGEKIFNPSKIDISEYCVDSLDDIFCDRDSYVLSIATHKKSSNYLFCKKMMHVQDCWKFV